MLRFLIKRLLNGILVLLGVATLIFFLFNVLPSPEQMLAGQRSDLETTENIRRELGLDRPVYERYFSYLNDLSPLSYHKTGDISLNSYSNIKEHPHKRLFVTTEGVFVLKFPWLRRSYKSNRPVNAMLSEAFPKTALLATVSILFALVFGILLGILSALNRGRLLDHSTLIVTVTGMSLPSFFAAIIIAWVFAWLLGDITGLNMVGSLYAVDDLGRGEYPALKNMILPALTLGIRPLAIITELTRNSLLDVMSEDYIRTARAKGASRGRVIFRHALRNALNPVITATSGWFASLLAGAVFVEFVFDWKGIGVMIVDSLNNNDLPVLMGSVLLIAVVLVIINIFVDILYGVIDPRVRLSN